MKVAYLVGGGIPLLLSIAFFLTIYNTAKVPNVVGQEVSYAKGILKGQGFETVTEDKIEDGIQPGQILSQEPAADSREKKGLTVKLVVAKPPIYSVHGSFTLIDSDIAGTGDYCYGTGGYEDIRAGMSVTVRDGKGSIIATGTTGQGTRPNGSEFSSVECVFEFQVDNIVKSDFYEIEIGRRGKLNYSFADMQQKNWEISLSLN